MTICGLTGKPCRFCNVPCLPRQRRAEAVTCLLVGGLVAAAITLAALTAPLPQPLTPRNDQAPVSLTRGGVDP